MQPSRRSAGYVHGDAPGGGEIRARAAPRSRLSWQPTGSRTQTSDIYPPASSLPMVSCRGIPPTKSDCDGVCGGRSRPHQCLCDPARELVSRDNNIGKGKHNDTGDPRFRNSPNLRFRQTAEQYFQLIEVQHHLNNLHDRTSGSVYLMIKNKVRELTKFLKPALPSEEVLEALEGRAQEWGEQIVEDLLEHYMEKLNILETQINEAPYHKWSEAFDTAVEWANSDLPEVTHGTLTRARVRVEEAHTGERKPVDSRPKSQRPIQNAKRCTDKTKNIGKSFAQIRKSTSLIKEDSRVRQLVHQFETPVGTWEQKDYTD